jgi:DNA-directed RNA polymerase specialized sigma24 family protein
VIADGQGRPPDEAAAPGWLGPTATNNTDTPHHQDTGCLQSRSADAEVVDAEMVSVDRVTREWRRAMVRIIDARKVSSERVETTPRTPEPTGPLVVVEPVVEVEPVEARKLDNRIRTLAHSIDGSWNSLEKLIAKAKPSEIHVALGFTSWTTYIADIAKSEMPNVARSAAQRRQVVALLSGEGMSQRAIADAVGVSKKTVQNDQATIEVDTKYPPEPDAIEAQQVLHDATPDTRTEQEPDPDPLPDTSVADAITRITGRDGKTYPAQASTPKAPRRQPITDSFRSAVYKLSRAADTVERLSRDDRFPQNLDSLAYSRSDLILARDALQGVIDKLGGG